MPKPVTREARHVAEFIDRLARVVRADSHIGALNPAQWDALRYLGSCNRFSNTPGALARYMMATKGTVSQTLNALERKGFVTRQPDPHSGRVVRLTLTRSGRAALHRDPLSQLAEAANALSAATQKTLTDGLAATLASLQRQNGHRPFGVCNTCRHFNKNHGDGGPHWCNLLNERLSDSDSAQICAEHAPIAA